MLRVWADRKSVGNLDRFGRRGTTFSYAPSIPAGSAVSVTMPPRTASWNSAADLLPIFQMNIPEGAMRERLRRMFAKATGSFDDLDLLGVVGRSQIGRLRYTAPDAELSEQVPFQSVDEILRARRGGELMEYLLDRFAENSGISGVQPKVLIRAEVPDHDNPSIMGATHIVKFWSAEYPELAANEHFCLLAADRASLPVPQNQLSADGAALVVERFDRRSDGTYLGFEDFCVLNGLGTEDKYNGGYETGLFKRISEFFANEPPAARVAALGATFRLFVLNCIVGNGDAHLKNFGILYEDAMSPVRLAPVYDVVTTRAYLPLDLMALTLNGSTKWPDRKSLLVLGQTRCQMGLAEAEKTIEEVADAVADTRTPIRRYFNDRRGNSEIGAALLNVWEDGLKRIGARFDPVASDDAEPKGPMPR